MLRACWLQAPGQPGQVGGQQQGGYNGQQQGGYNGQQQGGYSGQGGGNRYSARSKGGPLDIPVNEEIECEPLTCSTPGDLHQPLPCSQGTQLWQRRWEEPFRRYWVPVGGACEFTPACRADEVRVIGEEKEMLGVMSLVEALQVQTTH